MRVVILRGGFQLHSFRTDQRAGFPARGLMPGGLSVVGFDPALFIHEQFHVVAIWQLGIEGVRRGFTVAARERSFQRECLDLAQSLRSAGSLDVPLDNLSCFLRGRRTRHAGQDQSNKDDTERCAHRTQV